MQVREIMTSPVITIPETAPLEQAAKLMTEHRVGGLPVVDASGDVVGFLTDSDFAAREHGVPFSIFKAPQVLGRWIGNEGVERIYEGARNLSVRAIMSQPPIWVKEDESIDKVVRILMEHDINRVVVLSAGKPIGIVARRDLLRLLLRPGLTSESEPR